MSESNVRQGAEIPTHVSVIGGSISGLVARFVIAPIDIVKIRLQLQNDPAKYKGVIDTLTKIVKNEGIRSLWKGNIPAEIMYLMYGAVQFTTYSSLNTAFSEFEKKYDLSVPNSLHSLMVGSLAGCISTTVSYPFDVLRTRLASNESPKFNSVLGEIKKIYKLEGPTGYFGGISISMTYIALSMGVAFGSYTYLKDLTEGTMMGPSCGLIAGAFSKFFIYPLDLLRRRRQMSTEVSSGKMALRILKKEGVLGFYHGLTPAIVKTAPATAISLWCYEYTVDFCLKLESKKLTA